MINPTILCVDNERNVLLTLRAQLLRCFPDCNVEIAESGTEALEVVEDILSNGMHISLVIADQIMPEMQGDELLIELHNRYPEIIKVMLTGEASAEDIGNVINRGSLYRFISKPWNETDLQLTVAEALRRYEQDRKIEQQYLALEQAKCKVEVLNASLERQVQDRTRQLRLFVEHTPASVAMFDREMRYLLTSQRWKEDYQLVDRDIIGRSHYDIFPELPERWREIHQHCLGGAIERCDEDCFIRADGAIIWRQWEIHPWYTDDNKIGGIIMFAQTITERKLAEIALKESEERYRMLTEVAAVGIFRFDELGQCVYVNNRWSDMTGRPSSVAMGLGWIETLHPEDRDRIPREWDEAFQLGGYYEGEGRYLRPDGSICWFYCQVLPEIDPKGNIISYVGSLTDITDRKLAEARQRQSEQENRSMLSAIPDLLLRVKIDGTCIDYIPPSSSTVDFLPISQHLSEILPSDILEHELQRIQQARKTGELQVWEQKLQRYGVECYEEVRLIPCGDDFLIIVRDITDRKLSEVAIRSRDSHKLALFKALPDLIMRIDKNGTYLEFQAPDNYRVIHRTEEFIGTKVHESLPLEIAQKRMEMIRCALANQSIQFYEQELSVDGEIQTEEVRVVPYNENEVLLLVRDISDRKLAEQAIKKSEEIAKEREQQLSTLLNNIPHIAWLKDRDGRFLAVNEPFARATGYEVSQLVGITDLDIWDRSLAEAYRRDDREVMDSGMQKRIEEHFLTASGTNQWLETIKSPVINDCSEAIGTAGIAIDISDRVQSELALQSLLEVTASVTGKEFFPELVKNIAIALDVSHVYISQQVGENLETLAWYADERIQPTKLTYQIAHTPCEFTVREGTYFCNDMRQYFPFENDKWGDMNVNCYHGVSLRDTTGKSLGVLFTLNPQSVTNPQRAEMLLHIFGARAVAELERMRAFEDLQILNEKLEQRVIERTQDLLKARNFLEAIIENIPLALFVKSGKEESFGKFVLWNNTCERMFGCSKEQAIGKTVYDFFPKEQSDFFHEKDRSSFALGITEDIPEEPIDSLTLGRRILHTVKVPIFDEHGNPDYLICISDDITADKQSEIALQESEERFRATFEQAAVGISQNRIDGKYMQMNQKYCDIVGYSDAELLSKSFAEVTYPDDLVIDNDNTRRLLSGEIQTFVIEKRYIRKDGQIVWTNLAVSLARDILGEPQYYIGVIQDISDRKIAEQNLQSERLRLQVALEAAEMGTWESNMDTGYWSERTEAIFGYAPRTFPGDRESFLKLVYADDQERVFNALAHSLTTQSPYKVEYRINHLHGEIRWVAVNGKVVQDQWGSGLRIIGVALDITERKQAEESIRVSQEKLQKERLRLQIALEAAKMGSWSCNMQKGYLYWSDRSQEIFGFVPGTFPNDRDTFLSMVHPDDYEQVTRAIADTFETGAPYQIEYRIKRLDGKVCWIAVWGIMHHNVSLDEWQLIGVVKDISDRKQSELERDRLLQELSQLNQELGQANQKLEEYSLTLEYRIEERTAELRSAQEQIIAQEKLASLGTLTAGVAHELRNPLNFVKNYAEGSIELTHELLEILQPSMEMQDSQTTNFIETLIADLQENASTIRHHSQRAADIITSMMLHARTDPHQYSTELKQINDLLKESIKLVVYAKWVQDAKFKVDIQADYDNDIGLIEVFPSTLLRAFINLIDNAFDATRFKKSEADIKYIPTLIISTKLVVEQVEIRIRDNGCGIDPQIQSKILDPFFTTKPPGSGTGLGLSLTYDIIVKQHQGAIAIDSKLGEFTEFVITIPYRSKLL